MSTQSALEYVFRGSGGRLALGSCILVYLIVYNEASAPCVLLGLIMTTLYASIAAYCKNSLKALQIPYLRASNKFDYTCIFLSYWMDTLAILCACGALTRTLSSCLDAMTGGLTRIMILGRNSPTNEIWPDVLGVVVIMMVTAMFMLGLEHTRVFSLITILGMFGLNAVISAVGWWTGDMLQWQQNFLTPNGLISFLSVAALLTYSYPEDFASLSPAPRNGLARLGPMFLIALVTASLLLAAGCLSTIVHYKLITDYVAVPIFNILDEHNFHKLVPAAACLLMLTCSGALLELFPVLFKMIVRFASSEWKILTKQISYESSESGSPVLAVFIAGSLCAMLTFACPQQHLAYTLAASHLSAGLFRALYLLYTPYRPRFVQPSNNESSLSYSRLSTTPTPVVKNAVSSSSSSLAARSKRNIWNLSLPKSSSAHKKSKVKGKLKKEVEKEWLLLGEPTSPCPQREQKDVECTILSDGEPTPSDFEYPDKFFNSDSDTSTDIDAIVDEYRQKVKVTTAGPMDRSIRIPTVSSWRVTIFAIIVLFLGIALAVAGIFMDWPPAIVTGVIGVFFVSLIMLLIPNYTGNVIEVNPIISCASLLFGVMLLSACISFSWPALIFWSLAGLIMLIRCDNWCCNCLNHETIINEQLIPSVSAKTTTIKMSRAPSSIVTLPTRISSSSFR